MLLFSNDSNPSSPTKNLLPLLLILAAITLTGLLFGVHALIIGHDHAFGTSREVPWGILITPYVFFACLATGICIISSLGQVFRSKTFAPMVNRAVFLAIIAMTTGLLSIALELESPWRMGIYGILSPNPLSNIWWKSSLYTIFLLFMTFNFLNLTRHKTGIARGFAIGGLIAVTCGNLNMNSDMALIGARGFWAENYMPLFFLIVSMLSACCAMIFLTWLSSKLQGRKIDGQMQDSLAALYKLSAVLLIGMLSFAFMKILGGFSPKFTENPEAMQLLVRGDFALNFWLGEIVLTGVLPIVLFAFSRGGKRLGLLALASFSSMLGIAVTFYDLIIVGQLIPHYYQYHLYDMPKFYSYSPSLHEYMMVIGAVGFFLTTFVLGEISFDSVPVQTRAARRQP